MSFQAAFPDTRYPIVCGPMANVAGAHLAVAVSRAGGLGLIGGGYSTDKLRKDVLTAIELIQGDDDDAETFSRGEGSDGNASRTRASRIRIGIGILTFSIKDQSIIHALLRDVQDTGIISSVWLFGGSEDAWIPDLKRAFPHLKVMVQVHTVQAARRVVAAGADVVVAQGSDAGGHGGAQCASIVSLVPEVVAALADGPSEVPVLAAGGIVNGRGMYAAMALGAAGVVLGTRFMLTTESTLPAPAKQLARGVEDGGRTTVQTRVYDEMRGTTDWPLAYTGRAIRNKTVEEALEGRDVASLKGDYEVAMRSGEGGGGDYSRVVCWAGTGVGLVDEVLPAGRVVEDLVKEYNEAVRNGPKAL